MKFYFEDLRRRIVAAVEGGMPKSEAAHLSDVSLSSVKRYSRLAACEETHAPARKKGGGRPPKANAAVASLLEEDVDRRPYAVGYRNQKLPVGDHSALGDALATLRLIEEMARG